MLALLIFALFMTACLVDTPAWPLGMGYLAMAAWIIAIMVKGPAHSMGGFFRWLVTIKRCSSHQ
jgi:hypothetical protein